MTIGTPFTVGFLLNAHELIRGAIRIPTALYDSIIPLIHNRYSRILTLVREKWPWSNMVDPNRTCQGRSLLILLEREREIDAIRNFIVDSSKTKANTVDVCNRWWFVHVRLGGDWNTHTVYGIGHDIQNVRKKVDNPKLRSTKNSNMVACRRCLWIIVKSLEDKSTRDWMSQWFNGIDSCDSFGFFCFM
jgi:hypothetical protein